tara:strand:- start:457 stop:579 length:123 start_codon:yes stop_codon:yes gene_type:complete
MPYEWNTCPVKDLENGEREIVKKFEEIKKFKFWLEIVEVK